VLSSCRYLSLDTACLEVLRQTQSFALNSADLANALAHEHERSRLLGEAHQLRVSKGRRKLPRAQELGTEGGGHVSIKIPSSHRRITEARATTYRSSSSSTFCWTCRTFGHRAHTVDCRWHIAVATRYCYSRSDLEQSDFLNLNGDKARVFFQDQLGTGNISRARFREIKQIYETEGIRTHTADGRLLSFLLPFPDGTSKEEGAPQGGGGDGCAEKGP
jgi:hypothetical protein